MDEFELTDNTLIIRRDVALHFIYWVWEWRGAREVDEPTTKDESEMSKLLNEIDDALGNTTIQLFGEWKEK